MYSTVMLLRQSCVAVRSNEQGVKGRSHRVEERISKHSDISHATSEPSPARHARNHLRVVLGILPSPSRRRGRYYGVRIEHVYKTPPKRQTPSCASSSRTWHAGQSGVHLHMHTCMGTVTGLQLQYGQGVHCRTQKICVQNAVNTRGGVL